MIEEVGQWRMVCNELAGFNPRTAEQIYDTDILSVAKSYISLRIANYVEPPEKKR